MNVFLMIVLLKYFVHCIFVKCYINTLYFLLTVQTAKVIWHPLFSTQTPNIYILTGATDVNVLVMLFT